MTHVSLVQLQRALAGGSAAIQERNVSLMIRFSLQIEAKYC